jgi:hypothetical protein
MQLPVRRYLDWPEAENMQAYKVNKQVILKEECCLLGYYAMWLL